MKSQIRKLLATLGYELRRVGTYKENRTDDVALRVAIQNGLQVNTVIDVGAAMGYWSSMCLEVFPQARYALIEPVPQYDARLSSLFDDFPNVTRVKMAASDSLGQATFFVHEDWYGSSLYRETEGSTVDGTPIQVQTTTIDTIVQQEKLSGPFLLKIDVQGAELKVLEGATTTLHQTEYVLVETSLFEFFENGPLIHHIIAEMEQRDFVIYDIINHIYRLLDNALGQVDLIFVPTHSLLRREHIYASPQQRKVQIERFKYENRRNV